MTDTSAPIVCGIDFSPESRRALVCASALASRLGCSLHIVSAIEPLLTEAARIRNQLGEFTHHIARDLRAFAGPLPLTADRVSFDAIAGEPAPVLLAAGADSRARMIVVGTRGRGQAARLIMGSTTMRLLRTADRPVLVTDWDDRSAVPESALGAPISRIVCGVDFSEGSLAAVEAAAQLAGDLGAEISLVHAVSSAAVPVGWDSLIQDVEAERLAGAATRLADVARKLKLAPHMEARLGPVAEVLAKETNADPHSMIAIGLRGAGHHRPGSTAIRVVSATSVPVLAVPE